MSSTVLVTGATGFVGKSVCEELSASGYVVRRAVRGSDVGLAGITVGEINGQTDWTEALDQVDTVIHLAARVHMLHDQSADPLAAYRVTNVAGTLNLVQQAIQAGVRRFIFLSSIKVNGERTTEKPFEETDQPGPLDPYGRSKWEAEQVLQTPTIQNSIEVVILRPPLIYGPGVKANFYHLLKATFAGIPLPLGAIKNQRSLLYLGNLVDALKCCINHPKAIGQTFLVCDATVSTPNLIFVIAASLGRSPRILNVPIRILQLLGNLAGKSGEVDRLISSLVINNRKILTDLNWMPPYTFEQGIAKTVEWFIVSKQI